MEIFNVGAGAVIWPLLSCAFLALLIAGVVAIARFFMRMSRRVDHLGDTLDRLARGEDKPQDA